MTVSLKGHAQSILGELYRVLLLKLKQKSTKSLSELGQSIRQLANSAYPTILTDVRDMLAKQIKSNSLDYEFE